MIALIYALFFVGGRASNAELQVMLDHSDVKTTKDLIREAAREGWVIQAQKKGGLVRLSPNGVAFLIGLLQDSRIFGRIECNKQMNRQRREEMQYE